VVSYKIFLFGFLLLFLSDQNLKERKRKTKRMRKNGSS